MDPLLRPCNFLNFVCVDRIKMQDATPEEKIADLTNCLMRKKTGINHPCCHCHDDLDVLFDKAAAFGCLVWMSVNALYHYVEDPVFGWSRGR